MKNKLGSRGGGENEPSTKDEVAWDILQKTVLTFTRKNQ